MSYSENGPRSGVNFWLVLLCLLLGVIVVRDTWKEKLATQQARPVTPREDLAAVEQATIAMFEEASPSVVFIRSIRVERTRSFFGGLNIQKIPSGTGTGFLWNDQGHVVTNFHVIQGANEAEVILSDQSVWKAEVIGAEPDKDIAVLKIDAPESALRPLHLGMSSDLRVGQSVYAIGNPFGLDQTLTTGVISGLNREIESVTRRPNQSWQLRRASVRQCRALDRCEYGYLQPFWNLCGNWVCRAGGYGESHCPTDHSVWSCHPTGSWR